MLDVSLALMTEVSCVRLERQDHHPWRPQFLKRWYCEVELSRPRPLIGGSPLPALT